MGIFRPLVGGVKSLSEYQAEELNHENDRAITPADLLTISRPLLAVKAAKMLINGEVGVTPIVAAMAATDAEGKLARFIDKRWPESGWGSTAHGAPWDTYADTSALLIVGAATLKAPRVTKPAKAAVSLIIAQEATKVRWAMAHNKEYMFQVRQEEEIMEELVSRERLPELPSFPSKLEIPSSMSGKEAMAEKLVATVAAVATNDFDNGLIRAGLSSVAVSMAVTGSIRGEAARHAYEPLVQQTINEQSGRVLEAQALLAA